MDLTDNVSDKRAELERCPPGHKDRDHALYNLAAALYDRFRAEGKIDDMDEAIGLHRAALEFRSSGHPDSITWLSVFRIVADLEEAVTLERATLELCPPGHSDRDVSLNNLARNLRMRFQKQAGMQDLGEAIKLHQEALNSVPLDILIALLRSITWLSVFRIALGLCPPGQPDCDASLHNLAYSGLRKYCQIFEFVGLRTTSAYGQTTSCTPEMAQ
ncbi:hypothetical protein F5J12DRAFT_786319 [Pisolithus orientalis]|uniref:uncharacterized protein n=1 Tax=Pisolithus orientalis TaxID=936130 RepID=UPI0022248655|nr:uncharacterized protein F5J12DRAFT_786319 [Pisolithus orientalis]KAI5991674.1 hypothetical protein F5J12DRAFT_786319 [Pisolithus orientalis]